MKTPRTRFQSIDSDIVIKTMPSDEVTSSAPTVRHFAYMSDFLSSDRSYNPVTSVAVNKPFRGLHNRQLGTSTWNDTFYLDVPFLSQHTSLFTDVIVPRALNELDVKLDFQRNNNFELLNLIGELDDLIATFTVKFWKSLTYGAFNWGLLPLISDIQSLSSSVGDVFGGGIASAIDKFSQTEYSTYTIRLKGDSINGLPGHKYEFEGELRLHGSHHITLPDGSLIPALQLFADELGVHPDLRTIWDLIPLSFVLDYFLPIGDILESLHPRGWFRPTFHFSGNASLRGELKIMQVRRFEPPTFYFPLESISNCYTRLEQVTNDFSYVDHGFPNDYSFGLSLRQLFNLGYLAKILF